MEPVNRIAQVRMDAGLSATELAAKLGVDKGTVSNWEAGRRQLTLERLTEIAGLLGVSVTYLLGLDEQVSHTQPVEKAMLPVLHRTPVWLRSRGWALVNSAKRQLFFADGSALSYDTLQEAIYMTPPAMFLSLRGVGTPLGTDNVLWRERVWVEPITTDSDLAAELRGWYRPQNRRLVENEFGNRFYLDTYGAKWLAFESCLADD